MSLIPAPQNTTQTNNNEQINKNNPGEPYLK
jgi:hypothetical protein